MTTSHIAAGVRDSGFGVRAPGLHACGLGLVVVLALGLAGCAKASATTVPDGPPLQMPEAPQRVLAPVEIPPAPIAAVEPEPVPAAAPAPTPPRPVAQPRPQPPAAAVPAQPPPPAPAPRDLRATSPAAVTERSVRDSLERATRDLGRVNYNRLSAEGRAQYDQSRRFSTQAEQALKERNLIFAATLADKAETLAVELLGR